MFYHLALTPVTLGLSTAGVNRNREDEVFIMSHTDQQQNMFQQLKLNFRNRSLTLSSANPRTYTHAAIRRHELLV